MVLGCLHLPYRQISLPRTIGGYPKCQTIPLGLVNGVHWLGLKTMEWWVCNAGIGEDIDSARAFSPDRSNVVSGCNGESWSQCFTIRAMIRLINAPLLRNVILI